MSDICSVFNGIMEGLAYFGQERSAAPQWIYSPRVKA